MFSQATSARRVVGQPSSNVILGDNSGPSKLAAISKHNLNTLSEDVFVRDLDEKTKMEKEQEQETIKQERDTSIEGSR